MQEYIDMTVEKWEEIYKPFNNHIDEDASFGGIMYETYGQELEYVRMFNNNQIWTWCDASGGGTYIVNGYHLCDRIGYFITEVPWTDGQDIFIDLEDETETEGE